MLKIIGKWFNSYFSDEQAVYLFVFIISMLALVLLLGKELTPVFAAMVIAYMMQGLIMMLGRWGLSPRASFGVVFALFATTMGLLLFVLFPLVWQQLMNFVDVQLPRVLANSESVLMLLPERYPEVVTPEMVEEWTAQLSGEVGNVGQTLVSQTLSSFPDVIAAMIFLVLLPILVFFFLKDRKELQGWLVSMLPENRSLLSRVWQEMDGQLSNYIRGKAVEIVIVAAVTFVAFTILDLNYSALLALVVGLSVIVPYVGATLVTLPVAIVAYFQFGTSAEFMTVIVVYGIIQALDGNLLVPILFSETVNLHPVAIIVAILIFGGVWGVWGVFFAIPLATLIKAIWSAWPSKGAEKA